MKILAVSDLHGDTKKAAELADRADREKVDLVILAGDLSYFEEGLENMIGPFVKKKKKVILIPGNHETLATADFLAQRYGAVNLHGYSIKYKDVGFFGCGGANMGLFKVSEKDMFALLKKGYDGLKGVKKKIMVTHIHPSGTIMEKLPQHVTGSGSVRKAVEEFKPDLLLCGHVHEASGLEEKIGNTVVINVSKEGKIIEI